MSQGKLNALRPRQTARNNYGKFKEGYKSVTKRLQLLKELLLSLE